VANIFVAKIWDSFICFHIGPVVTERKAKKVSQNDKLTQKEDLWENGIASWFKVTQGCWKAYSLHMASTQKIHK